MKSLTDVLDYELKTLRAFMKARYLDDRELVVTSNQVVSAQYRADFDDDYKADDIIARYTRLFNPDLPDHSHSEIGFWINHRLIFFSATGQKFVDPVTGEERTGTRWIAAEDLLKNPERWDLYAKVFDFFKIRRMLERANKECNKPYDWTGIGGFAFFDMTRLRLQLQKWITKKIDTLRAWYCSRVSHFVETGKIIRVSPKRRTAWLLKNKWVHVNYIHGLTIKTSSA